ncbi:MAG: S1C family serine protease [Chloroflexota bacterium]
MKNLILITFGSILGAAIIVGFSAAQLGPSLISSVLHPPVQAASIEQCVAILSEEAAVDIYQRLTQSVVNVSNKRAVGGDPSQGHFTEKGIGSGVILDNKGFILTNNHVIDEADRLEVTFVDGTKATATLVGSDPGTDLALIQVEASEKIRSKLIAAPLGDSDRVRPGQVAIAIGSPFGFQNSMTVGIVSSLSRTFSIASGRPIRNMIQVDAAINPGNSGGPLINTAGEVVGINTAIESPVRGFVGIGFAVPINSAKRLLPDLMAGKTIEHPWLGITGVTVNEEIVQEAGLSVDSGVYVVNVIIDSPAHKASIIGSEEPTHGQTEVPDIIAAGGDVVVAVDGQPVVTIDQLADYIDTKKVGDNVTLTVVRDGNRVDVPVLLEGWPEP